MRTVVVENNMADRLQRRMPHFSLSSSWWVMCNTNAKSLAHLFGCFPFALPYWNFMSEASGWNLAMPVTIFNSLACVFAGYPFRKEDPLAYFQLNVLLNFLV